MSGNNEEQYHGFPSRFGADFSADKTRRLILWQLWGPEPLLGFLMLNPSKAGQVVDGRAITDPTTVRNAERARRLGYGGILQTNLYDYIATDPADLKRAGYPQSAENVHAILRMAGRVQGVVLACGAHARRDTLDTLVAAIRVLSEPPKLYHLGLVAGGLPRHPLHTSYATPLQDWT